jgi:hypothetical protein
MTFVYVDWSPGPRISRANFTALEETRSRWFPEHEVNFYELHPEAEEELNRWYDEMLQTYHPRFALHGHGNGPIWWMERGEVVACTDRPAHAYTVDELQRYSRKAFTTPTGRE